MILVPKVRIGRPQHLTLRHSLSWFPKTLTSNRFARPVKGNSGQDWRASQRKASRKRSPLPKRATRCAPCNVSPMLPKTLTPKSVAWKKPAVAGTYLAFFVLIRSRAGPAFAHPYGMLCPKDDLHAGPENSHHYPICRRLCSPTPLFLNDFSWRESDLRIRGCLLLRKSIPVFAHLCLAAPSIDITALFRISLPEKPHLTLARTG